MSDLETALRATLAEAEVAAPAPADLAERLIAATIGSHGAALDGEGRSTHRGFTPAPGSRRWLAPLLAAAAVVAIAVGVTIGIRATQPVRPAHPTPTTTSSQPTPPAPSTRALTPLRCVTALPTSWQSRNLDGTTIAAPSLLYGGVAVDASGELISVRYTSSHAYEVLLLAPNTPPRVLYRTPPGQPSPEQAIGIRSVGAEGTWVAFTVVGGGHRAQIVLVNLATNARTVVRTIPEGVDMLSTGRVLAHDVFDSGLTVAGGALYWAEIQAGQTHGRLYRYDIATGQRQVLDTRATSGPLTAARGAVYWNRGGRVGSNEQVDIGSWPHGAFLPAGVDWMMHPALLPAADGAYVWQDASGAIEAQRPAAGGPVTIVPASRNARLERVIGDFLWAAGGRSTIVMDLHTGAAARWGLSDDQGPGGTATTALFAGRSGFTAVDASKLPALHC
jgi:hypothetical protein